MFWNAKVEILRRFTPQNDSVCHSEQSDESNLMFGNFNLLASPLKRGDKGVCKNAFDTPPSPSF